jgi:hypothetical protein
MSARSTARVLALSVALVAVLVLVPRTAEAAPCGRPDVDTTFPPNGAGGVPPNALLSAHYSNPADYVDEVVTLTGPFGDVPVDVSYDEAESMLRAIPSAELAAGSYVIAWPGLRGVATNRGLGLTSDFVVGAVRDGEAPRFSGLETIEWDLERELDPCTDTHEDRFFYDLGFDAATDDVDPGLLAVVVFETRAGGHSAPEQIAVRAMPDERRLRVERPATGGETVCFAAVTRDLVMNVSGGGDREVCVETTEPPFFDGCSLGRRGTTGPAVVLLALGVLVGVRRRGARRA